ncbi:DUF6907 domain-containing protein [Streptomyces flavofungini]|uniref:DUF6907 domain-containing protein n=1 Tax=Streptomyces flavofungini TaxID=68200 RepID=UPI0025B0962F|nr:hypothetical protein [Streptomyces flavofungini]WJV47666.1 hypothetical protein QUY26_20330 [Streptomyces flavofungini]
MSAARTVTVHTLDHGPITITCPDWCIGHEGPPQYRVDLSHFGPDRPLTLPTRRGPAIHLVTALEVRPYVDDSFLRLPFVGVHIGGDWYPTGLAGLEAMADALTAQADALRDQARELAVILAGGRP